MPIAKADVVEQLTGQFQEASGVYFADFRGMPVATMTELRNNFRGKGIKVRVAKNTLIKRALDACQISGLDKYLIGPTAILFADEQDPIAPAKLLVDFQKSNDGLMEVKAVHIDGQRYDGKELDNLAMMPGKRELQAQVVSLAMGPSAQLIGLIKGPAGQIAGQIKAFAERLEKEGK